MDLPTRFAQSPSFILEAGDTIPSNIDPSTISIVGGFLSAPLAPFTSNPCTTVSAPDNGEGVTLHSTISEFFRGQEWTTVETVLIRYNAVFAINGSFPVYVSKINTGYDAAVCVQKYEPWIVEAYNTTFASPSVLRLVEKGDGSTSQPPNGTIRGPPIAGTRYLNTTEKSYTFNAAHGNGIHQMMKINDGGNEQFWRYVPTPTVGPVPCITSLLTSTNYTGHFLHQWHWTFGIYRTLPRAVRHCPRTDRCG